MKGANTGAGPTFTDSSSGKSHNQYCNQLFLKCLRITTVENNTEKNSIVKLYVDDFGDRTDSKPLFAFDFNYVHQNAICQISFEYNELSRADQEDEVPELAGAGSNWLHNSLYMFICSANNIFLAGTLGDDAANESDFDFLTFKAAMGSSSFLELDKKNISKCRTRKLGNKNIEI
uniref:Uncharacterized protein n=1 Tax=Romanomermis culicivorax TaxID=13658 RepID=A0A915IYG7_ROMCU